MKTVINSAQLEMFSFFNFWFVFREPHLVVVRYYSRFCVQGALLERCAIPCSLLGINTQSGVRHIKGK